MPRPSDRLVRQLDGTGLERPSTSSGNNEDLSNGGAKSGAVDARAGQSDGANSTLPHSGLGDEQDVGLARIVTAWPTLPESVRGAILALLGERTSGIE